MVTLALTPTLCRTFEGEVRGLAWTKTGSLVVVTGSRVIELPSGRSRPLRRFAPKDTAPIRRLPERIALDAGHARGIGEGFLLDLRTLATTPLRRPALWDDDQKVEFTSRTSDPARRGLYWIHRTNRRIALAPGWFVLGVSEDLRLALATRGEPFDGQTTSLLRLDPKTGRASILAAYPQTSDDHTWLSWASEGPDHRVFLHSENLNGGRGNLMRPFFGLPARRTITFPHLRSLMPVSTFVEWTAPKSPWALVRRHLMLDRSPDGLDTETLDLWNVRSRRLLRLAKVTNGWGNRPRADGPRLGAYAFDPVHQRLAYAVVTPGRSRIETVRISKMP